MLDNIFGYGLGDGGHGPIEGEITAVKAMKRLAPKQMKYFQRGDFYGLFKKHMHRWPTWTDELYLELHRGTYTTHSIIKKMNRVGETIMETLEKMFVIGSINLNHSYPRDEFEKHWKLVLYNQFHDILPGSSIPEVYEDALKDYQQVLDFYAKQSPKILSIASQHASALKSNDNSILTVFNPLNWSRTDALIFETQQPFSQALKNGQVIPVQSYEKRGKKYGIILPEQGSETCQCLSYHHYELTNNSSTSAPKDAGFKSMIQKQDLGYKLENEFVSVSVLKSGLISSIFDKRLKHELCGKDTCEFQFYNEGPRKNCAWNINKNYLENKVDYPHEPQIKISADGPHFAELTLEFKFQDSLIIERIGIFKNSNKVHFSIDLDWKEKQILCKFAVNHNLTSEEIRCEIPYSFIDRPIKRTRVLDKTRFEYSCQRWVSVFDDKKNIGLTISNNSKYGFSVEDTEIRMTVVRSPKNVDYAQETMFVNRAPNGGLDPTKPQYSDNHYHEDICFTLEVHQGDVLDSPWKSALELNYPTPYLITAGKQVASSNSSMPKSIDPPKPKELFKADKPNVLIGALKVHEDESDLSSPSAFVIRVIEMSGKETEFNMFVGPHWIEWYETDLLEIDTIGDVHKVGSETIQMKIFPFEIKTLILKK
jgi:alpha-mannosidase